MFHQQRELNVCFLENGASEWVSGTGVSSITRDEWKVVAHEVGHGFGMFFLLFIKDYLLIVFHQIYRGYS